MNTTNFTLADFQVGQTITYTNGGIFTGEIVKVSHELVVIGDKDGMTLWNAGYAVGDCIQVEQVLSIN